MICKDQLNYWRIISLFHTLRILAVNHIRLKGDIQAYRQILPRKILWFIYSIMFDATPEDAHYLVTNKLYTPVVDDSKSFRFCAIIQHNRNRNLTGHS